MKIIVIDTFQHSLKFTLFQMENETILCSGLIERIGLEGSLYTIKTAKEKVTEEVMLENYKEAVSMLIQKLSDLEIITSGDEIKVVAYRIPQGKNEFRDTCFLGEEELLKLETIDIEIPEIKAVKETVTSFYEVLPSIEVIGVFETAFFKDLPEESFLYALPYQWYENYGVRKYGTQGITHQYITKATQELFQREKLRIISCCLDEVGSIAAIEDGKCIDISTGFSSLSGIVMGTKSGDIDSSIIPYVMEKEGKNVSEILEDLNQRSGLLGLSEFSGNLEEILIAAKEGNNKAIIAKNQYIRHIVNYIAQYYVLLQGVDAIIFTASIGEKSSEIREEIAKKLSCLGVKIDSFKNNSQGMGQISREDSTIPMYVIPMNLELEIAHEAMKLLNR